MLLQTWNLELKELFILLNGSLEINVTGCLRIFVLHYIKQRSHCETAQGYMFFKRWDFWAGLSPRIQAPVGIGFRTKYHIAMLMLPSCLPSSDLPCSSQATCDVRTIRCHCKSHLQPEIWAFLGKEYLSWSYNWKNQLSLFIAFLFFLKQRQLEPPKLWRCYRLEVRLKARQGPEGPPELW